MLGQNPGHCSWCLGIREKTIKELIFLKVTEHFKSLKKLNDPDWIEIQPLEV
jgi:hypothetical protein